MTETTEDISLTKLTEKVAALGYSGKELTIRVLTVAVMQAALVGNRGAEEHFIKRVKELSA